MTPGTGTAGRAHGTGTARALPQGVMTAAMVVAVEATATAGVLPFHESAEIGRPNCCYYTGRGVIALGVRQCNNMHHVCRLFRGGCTAGVSRV